MLSRNKLQLSFKEIEQKQEGDGSAPKLEDHLQNTDFKNPNQWVPLCKAAGRAYLSRRGQTCLQLQFTNKKQTNRSVWRETVGSTQSYRGEWLTEIESPSAFWPTLPPMDDDVTGWCHKVSHMRKWETWHTLETHTQTHTLTQRHCEKSVYCACWFQTHTDTHTRTRTHPHTHTKSHTCREMVCVYSHTYKQSLFTGKWYSLCCLLI